MSLGTELARFLGPLPQACGSTDGALALLRELGLVDDGPASLAALPDAIADLAAAADAARETLAGLDGGDTVAAVSAAVSVLEAIQSLVDTAAGPVGAFPMPFDVPDTWTTLAGALPGHLLARWLRDHHPVADGTLRGLGAVTDDGPGRARIDFDALGRLLSDPPGQVRTVVGDDPAVLLGPLQAIAAALGGTHRARTLTFTDQRARVDDGVAQPAPRRLDLGLASPELDGNWAVDVGLEPVSADGGTAGLQILATASGDVGASAALTPEWTLTALLALDGAAGFVLVPTGVTAADANTAQSASLTLTGAPEVPWVLLGGADATRLELGGLTFALTGDELTRTPSVAASLRTEALRLVVQAGDGDSFIAGVLGGFVLSADASLDLTWSSGDGFSLGTSELGVDLLIPIERTLGPIVFKSLRIGAGLDAGDVVTELGASIGFALGPIAAIVEDIGLRVLVGPAATPGRGAFGDVDFTLAFKPPIGLGITVAAEVVTGGGYLECDPDRGRYAGAAELDILSTGLTAVGVVTTGDDWSMFLSLGIRLTGVQLGFGFTLNGVGGLVGVNRGLDDEALGDAVRSGSLDAILFPEDPVAQADQILADIDTVFPAAGGQYVFGPVVKIGWGTPTLIELDVGVAIQFPDPISISLLGALSAELPTEDEALLELHVEFAGTVNLTEGTLKIDASLSGSQVAGLEITGDMAVRADFLGEPTFLVAFGGFHPAFDPPADFPALERVGIALDTGDDLRITLGGYFALTSNTVQFGSAAEVFAQAEGFTAEGGTSFDALITFKPFGFVVALEAWVSITAGSTELMGVQLSGTFSGPDPWHAAGRAEFRLLGVKAHLEIEATIGAGGAGAVTTSVDVAELLHAALERDDAWSVLAPEGATPVIVSAAGDGLAVDPSGRIQVLQRIVPLGREIEQYGTAALTGANLFTVTAPGFAAEDVATVDDWFAAAQFYRLGEAEKLSSPSFSLMAAGLALGGSDADAPDARDITFDHEIVYRDTEADPDTGRLYRATDATLGRALATRDVGAPAQRYTVGEPRFVVSDRETGASAGAATDFFTARAVRSGDAVVVPEYELELLA